MRASALRQGQGQGRRRLRGLSHSPHLRRYCCAQDAASDAFFAGFYPPRTLTNQTAGVKGETWSVDPYGQGSDDFASPIDFYLIGAAWTRAG